MCSYGLKKHKDKVYKDLNEVVLFVVLRLTSEGLQLPQWRRDVHVERMSLAQQQQQLVQPRRLLCYSEATGEKTAELNLLEKCYQFGKTAQ